jgi:hypothetical protein
MSEVHEKPPTPTDSPISRVTTGVSSLALEVELIHKTQRWLNRRDIHSFDQSGLIVPSRFGGMDLWI